MLPLDTESQLAEQGRVLMVSQRAANEDVRHFYINPPGRFIGTLGLPGVNGG